MEWKGTCAPLEVINDHCMIVTRTGMQSSRSRRYPDCVFKNTERKAVRVKGQMMRGEKHIVDVEYIVDEKIVDMECEIRSGGDVASYTKIFKLIKTGVGDELTLRGY
jgi:hypothetical protein